MKLADLVGPEIAEVRGALGEPVAGLASDSRRVAPGFLFAALPGVKADGAAFVRDALARGAAAVLAAQAPDGFPADRTLLISPEPRRALALMAARFFPRQPETIVAVTGTSGKTSVASFARQLFAGAGCAAASLGTLGVVAPGRAAYGALTTPDPIELMRLLDELAREGVTHLAMEASSHGLDQRRLDGVRLAAAAFTNLSRDHLDYHASSEAYLAAKLRLATDLLPAGRPFVIDADGASAEAFAAAARTRGDPVFSVGVAGRDIAILERRRLPGGQHLSLGGPFGRAEIDLPLVGDFQAANALVAAGLALAVGIAPGKVFAGLARLEGVRGRLDKVGERDGAAVYVDYAHKPDALANVLAALRPYTRGRLVVAFGCGGDRDAGKRPEMGAIAARAADVVIVTDDNPRSESPAAIRRAILDAAPGALEIGDRARAIREGVAMLRSGDVFVIAGKGHETGQIVGAEVLAFSDHEVAAAALGETRG
jgi:UDP-N-acetylmuramoyl-L-alanyl-D-glutamate--2,6-diaminopimelate ligase